MNVRYLRQIEDREIDHLHEGADEEGSRRSGAAKLQI